MAARHPFQPALGRFPSDRHPTVMAAARVPDDRGRANADLSRSGVEPCAVAALLKDLADRALQSEFEPVICQEGTGRDSARHATRRRPQRLPAARRTRYTTRALLATEERMHTRASADGAPQMTCAQARTLSARTGPGALARPARPAHANLISPELGALGPAACMPGNRSPRRAATFGAVSQFTLRLRRVRDQGLLERGDLANDPSHPGHKALSRGVACVHRDDHAGRHRRDGGDAFPRALVGEATSTKE